MHSLFTALHSFAVTQKCVSINVYAGPRTLAASRCTDKTTAACATVNNLTYVETGFLPASTGQYHLR